jgi:hypothetical protein
VSNLRRLRRSITPDPSVDRRPGAALAATQHDLTGRHNAYRCDDCGHFTVVVHVDTGVTPMFLACRATEGCKGQGVSLGYPEGPIPKSMLPARWEWYRPTSDDPILNHPGMREHVERGGLALRAAS